jgi:chromosome segregation protein
MHALARAKDDRLGKAVLLHPLDDNLQSQPHIEAGTESRQFTQMQPQDELHHDSRSFSQPAETRATATKPTETLPTETHMCAARLVSANASATDTDIANRVVAAVRYLLRDIAVAQTKESALSMLAEGSWQQVVTKDGEVISRVGAVGGSSLSQSNLSLAARRDKALQQVSKLDDETQELQSEVTQAQTLRDEARLALDHAAQQRTEERLKAQQSERELKSSAGLVSDLEHRVNGVEAKMKTCADEGETHHLKLDDLRRALQSMQESTSEEADVDELSERERSLSSSLAATREQEITMKIAWNEANHQVESLHRQAGLLHDNAKDAVRRRERMETLNTRRQEQAEHIELVGKQAEQIAGIVHRSVEEVVARREELQHSASVHDDELKTLRAQRNEIEPEVAHLQGREHELDVDRERMAAQYGQLTQKVSDDLGLSLEELVRDFGPEKPVPVLDDNGQPVLLDDDGLKPKKTTETGRINGVEPTDAVESINPVERTDAQDVDERHQETKSGQEIDAQAQVKTVPYVKAEQLKRLEKAQRDLKALGKINPLATEEYDALQTRNQYLHDQRNDVAQSRDDLMKLIKDLDATMVEVFTSAFADTARAFEKVFATLFPGGTGRLRLENPDDPLTTGVIVEASPAGKRVKQLSLLSGGERSLTALALLFAIFTARPSPFYVMDEVEAALDDVNLTRLLNALNDLREHAQLIIITHQQRTMSIADALYGVTMRSDGVTAVMSQKLAHGKSD